MNMWFLLAAGLMAATLFIHCYFGGRRVVPPLLKSEDLGEVPKTIHYGNWHVATIVFVGMTLNFLWAATHPDALELAVFSTLVAAAISVWAAVVILRQKQSFKRILHWLFFLLIAAAGTAGLATSYVAADDCAAPSFECALAPFSNDKHGDLHSVIVIQNGETLVEHYYSGGDRQTLVDVRSAGKSVTSLLFGIALDRGAITSLDDTVAKYWPNAAGSAIGSVRLADILTMRTGLDADGNNPDSLGYEDHMDEADDPLGFALTIPRLDEPGTRYRYNSLAAYITGVVIGRATGGGLESFARNNLFKPLEFAHWNWQEDRAGQTKGQGNLFLTAPDFARIGQLVLNSGSYNGQQVVSENWIEESLKRRVDVSAYESNAVGYGFYWFYQTYTVHGRKIAVSFASGNGGNKIYVIPELNMVVSVMSRAYGQGRGQRRSENILKAILAATNQR